MEFGYLENWLNKYIIGDRKNRFTCSLSVTELTTDIQKWINHNKGDLPNLFFRKLEIYDKLKLPYLNRKACPRNKAHEGTIKDLGGRIRCAHVERIEFKPNFLKDEFYFDELSQMRAIKYSERKPQFYELDPEYLEILDIINPDLGFFDEINEFEKEEPTLIIPHQCYAILSDKDSTISLESVLKRLKIKTTKKTLLEFRFDNIVLAGFIRKWYEVFKGKAPFFDSEFFEDSD